MGGGGGGYVGGISISSANSHFSGLFAITEAAEHVEKMSSCDPSPARPACSNYSSSGEMSPFLPPHRDISLHSPPRGPHKGPPGSGGSAGASGGRYSGQQVPREAGLSVPAERGSSSSREGPGSHGAYDVGIADNGGIGQRSIFVPTPNTVSFSLSYSLTIIGIIGINSSGFISLGTVLSLNQPFPSLYLWLPSYRREFPRAFITVFYS